MYHLPHVCSHTLVPETGVYALKCSMYSDILTCSHACIYNCTQLRRTGATCVCHQDYKTGIGARECADTWYKLRFSLLRQYIRICSYPATCQCACVNQKQLMGIILLF